MRNLYFIPFIFVVTLGLSACATSNNTAESVNDPLEPFNRAMFAVNNQLDKFILRPAAIVYGYVPAPARYGVSNALNNLGEPLTAANDLLQGQVRRAGTTVTRFGINSTIGLLGLIDMAEYFGFEGHSEDFGQTLAVYGVGEGFYLFLPIFGPTSPRDLVGELSQTVLEDNLWDSALDNTNSFNTITTALGALSDRQESLELLDEIERTSVDYYATIRSFYRQSRAAEIANQEMDIENLPDIDGLDMSDLDMFDMDMADNGDKANMYEGNENEAYEEGYK
ncbi:MAG: VacJ family lipoprotein [Alphaproteobacteria bacterium]|nr:VacJ family lipoprotein [Alphaproteobacteria bacterium]